MLAKVTAKARTVQLPRELGLVVVRDRGDCGVCRRLR